MLDKMHGAAPADPQRLVLFDLDNTLIDRAQGFRVWARVISAYSLPDAGEVEWLERADNDGLTQRPTLFAGIRSRYGLREPVDALVQAYREQFPRCIPPLPDETRTVLRELRQRGWKLGIVTNGGAQPQESKIRSAGLDKLVDGWVISEVLGARKPDAAIFRAASTACERSLAGGWMVGDNPEADIAGAAAAGLSSVWITRGREWTEPTFQPDAAALSVAGAASEIITQVS